MGELSRELEKAKNQHQEVALPTTGKSKSKALQDAGISTSRAHRAEEIASIPEAEFEEMVEREKPPSLSNFYKKAVNQPTEAWP